MFIFLIQQIDTDRKNADEQKGDGKKYQFENMEFIKIEFLKKQYILQPLETIEGIETKQPEQPWYNQIDEGISFFVVVSFLVILDKILDGATTGGDILFFCYVFEKLYMFGIEIKTIVFRCGGCVGHTKTGMVLQVIYRLNG